MTAFLSHLLGRLPLGWLQLTHSPARLIAALAGVAFANVLVFVQLGMLGALTQTTAQPYKVFEGDIMISARDSNTLTDGGNVARQYMLRALAVPGIASATPVFIGQMDWQITDQRTSRMLLMAMPPDQPDFLTHGVRSKFLRLALPDTVMVDTGTRGGSKELFQQISPGTPATYELNDHQVQFIDTFFVGAGFTTDGALLMSDQSFLRLFPSRSSAAPSHLLLKVSDGASIEKTAKLLQQVLPHETVQIRTIDQAMADDTRYQTTERPVGVIFGLGVAVGLLVGLVIVYQVLSTDVADHLSEYATFKAMGYGQPFFLGVIFEEALILAILGFIPGCLVAMGFYTILEARAGLPVGMTTARAVTVFLGTLAACSISGAIATRRLTKADPADLF